MAAQLGGLFAQLNQAISENPLNKEYDFSVAGEPRRPMDSVNPMLGGAVQSIGRAAGVKGLETSEQAVAARKEKHKAAVVEQAAALGLSAEAKQAATGAPGAIEEAMRAIAAEKKRQADIAAAVATDERDVSAAEKLADAKVTSAAEKAKNEMALEDQKQRGRMAKSKFEQAERTKRSEIAAKAKVDKANIDAADETGGRGEVSTRVEIRIHELQDNAAQAASNARQAASLADAFEKADMSAGLFSSGIERFLKDSGQRDEESWLRTQAVGFKNLQVMEALPPGPASDKDIFIVMEGAPPNNAPTKEWESYFRGLGKVAALDAEYNDFQLDYIAKQVESGQDATTLGGRKAWKEYAAKKYPELFGEGAPEYEYRTLPDGTKQRRKKK